MTETLLFAADALVEAARAITVAAGSTVVEATRVAANLVEANLRGHDSHGVGMLPRYVDAVREGGLVPNAHVAVRKEAGPLLALDGNLGYGQSIGHEAMELAAERAAAHGVCVVALSRSHHLGRIGQWAEQCIGHGLVSIHFVNVVSRPIVAPYGGGDARLGTNPFCVGIPRKDATPVVLDFATSKIAQGKTRVAYNQGATVPEGTILDDRGQPTTDPRYTVVEPFGALLPFGGHKGAGLAFVCELLAALAGGETARPQPAGQRRVLNAMFSVVVDPARLGTAAHLAAEMEHYIAHASASPPRGGVDRVRYPGEVEVESRQARMAGGIPVDAVTWREIVGAGATVKVDVARLCKPLG